MLSISTLREYIDLEMKPVASQLKMPYDLERIIDDYVFLCIFVGNDFLPSLPLLDIREGAVTMLMNIYRRLLPTWSDYIIQPGGSINYLQVQSLMSEVFANEGNILRRKRLFGKYTVGNLQRPQMKEEATKDLELGDEESVNLVNLFIKHMIDNVMNSKEPGDQKYVKTIQMCGWRACVTGRFDLRLRQLVKAYYDNVPKNDVAEAEACEGVGGLQSEQLERRVLPEEDGHRALRPRVDRARVPGVHAGSDVDYEVLLQGLRVVGLVLPAALRAAAARPLRHEQRHRLLHQGTAHQQAGGRDRCRRGRGR